MYKLWCTLVLGVLVLAFQAYANPSADDAQDDSVDSVAAAAIYAGDLLGSDAMGMTSKRSLDLFPRTNCGYGRFYCPHAGECCLRNFGCCEHGGCTPPGWECCPGGSCPPGWGCCGSGRCVPPGGTCCDDGSYCEAGQYCVRRGHQMGCCRDPSCRGKGHYQEGIKYEYQPVHVPDTVTEYKIETVGDAHAPQITVIYDDDRHDDYKDKHHKPEHPKPGHPKPEHPKPEHPKPEHHGDLHIPPEHHDPYPPHDPPRHHDPDIHHDPYDTDDPYKDDYHPGVYGDPYDGDAYDYTVTWAYYSYGTRRDDDETFVTSVYVTDTTTVQIYADNRREAINSFERLTETISLPTPFEATRLRGLSGLAPTSGSYSNTLTVRNTWNIQRGWFFPIMVAFVILAPGVAMILL